MHLTSIDAKNKHDNICSKINVLYAFMEQTRAGGGTAALDA